MNNEQKAASKKGTDQGSPVNLSSSVESGLRTGSPSVSDPLLVAEKDCCPVEGADSLTKALGETNTSKPSAVDIPIQLPLGKLHERKKIRVGFLQTDGLDTLTPSRLSAVPAKKKNESIGPALLPGTLPGSNIVPVKPACFSCSNGSRQCLNVHKECSSAPIDALRNTNQLEATAGWPEKKDLEFSDLSECNGSCPCSNEYRSSTIVPNDAPTHASVQFVVRTAENGASMFESSDTGPGPAPLGIFGAQDVHNGETSANASNNAQIVVNHKKATIGRPNEPFVSIYDLGKRNRRFVNSKMRSNAAGRTLTHDIEKNNSATSPGDLRSGSCETNATSCPCADIISCKQVSHAKFCNEMPIVNDSLARSKKREVLGTAATTTSVGSLFDNSTHLGRPTESAMLAQLQNELERLKQQCFANKLQYNRDLENCDEFWHERIRFSLTSEQQRVYERLLAEQQRCKEEIAFWQSTTLFHINRADNLEERCIALSVENEMLRSKLAPFSASPASSMQSSSRMKADEPRGNPCVANRALMRKTHFSASNASTQNENRPFRTAPLTVEERQLLMKEGKCFRCRQKGHLSNRCPNEPPSAHIAHDRDESGSPTIVTTEKECDRLGLSKWQQHECCSYLTPPLSWSTTSEKKIGSNRTLRRREARKQQLHARIAPTPLPMGEDSLDSFSEQQLNSLSSSAVFDRANVRTCYCAPHDERCQRNSRLREPCRSDAMPSTATPREVQRMVAAIGSDERSVLLEAMLEIGNRTEWKYFSQKEISEMDQRKNQGRPDHLGCSVEGALGPGRSRTLFHTGADCCPVEDAVALGDKVPKTDKQSFGSRFGGSKEGSNIDATFLMKKYSVSSGFVSGPRSPTQSELPSNDLMATMPSAERLGYVCELPLQLRHEPAHLDANNSKLQQKHHGTIPRFGLDFTRSAADPVCFAKVKGSGQSVDIPPAGEQDEEQLPGSENEEGEPEPGQSEASARGPTAHAHDSDSDSGDEADDVPDDLEVPTTQHYLVAPDIQQLPPNLNNVVSEERYTATVKIRIKHQETWVIINPSSSVSLVSEEYLRTHQRRDSIVRYSPKVTGIRGACPEALAVTACVSLRVSIPGIRSFHFDFHVIPSRHRVIIGEDLLQHRYLGLSRSLRCSYTLGTLSIGNSADMRMLRKRFYEFSSRDCVPLPSVDSRGPEVRADDSLPSTSGLPPAASAAEPDTASNDINRQEESMSID